MKVRFTKLKENAVCPSYQTADAAGADLYSAANGDVVIPSGETVFVPTGISLEIPRGYVGLIFARSGLACKKGVAPANKVGVIDSDYRGEIMVALHNHSKKTVTVSENDRVAQIAIIPYITAQFEECESLSDTDRGEKGFGSTGN